jgi:hypothetical protein
LDANIGLDVSTVLPNMAESYSDSDHVGDAEMQITGDGRHIVFIWPHTVPLSDGLKRCINEYARGARKDKILNDEAIDTFFA